MNILFVCTGNTCRSAMAEAMLKKMIAERGIKHITVKSCGIYAQPSFQVPAETIDVMREEGIDISAHQATPVSEALVSEADLILVMANAHKRFIDAHFPAARDKTFLLKAYVNASGGFEVPDPMGKPLAVYEKTKEDLKKYLDMLLQKAEV